MRVRSGEPNTCATYAAFLGDEDDAAGLEGGAEGGDGARLELIAALEARARIGRGPRGSCEIPHPPAERHPGHAGLDRQDRNRVPIILRCRNNLDIIAPFRFRNKRGTAPHGVGKVRMGRNRDGDGLAGGGADAALIATCAAFHAAFEQEKGARRVSDEEGDRLADETDTAFRQIVGTTPATAAGLAAKASAALTRLLWQVAPLKDLPWRDQASAGEQAALECLAALAGRELP